MIRVCYNFFKKLTDERHITFSTKRSERNFYLSRFSQSVLLLLFLCLTFSSAYVITVVSIKQYNINKVYTELEELRKVNSNLLQNVETINNEIDSIKSTFPNASKSKVTIRKAEGNTHTDIAGNISMTVYTNLFALVDSINCNLAQILETIQSTGISPYDFVNEKTHALERVKILRSKFGSIHKDIENFEGSFAEISEQYAKRRRYYYISSKVLDALSISMGHDFRGVYVDSDRSFSVYKILQSVMASFPIHSPLSKFVISSRYGKRIDPINRSEVRMHYGVDLVSNHGATVSATGSGLVAFAGFRPTYGYSVDIDHGFGIVSRYAHLGEILVKTGQKVSAMDALGFQGNTGLRCKGSHLHYELIYGGKRIDPIHFVYAKNINKKSTVA